MLKRKNTSISPERKNYVMIGSFYNLAMVGKVYNEKNEYDKIIRNVINMQF